MSLDELLFGWDLAVVAMGVGMVAVPVGLALTVLGNAGGGGLRILIGGVGCIVASSIWGGMALDKVEVPARQGYTADSAGLLTAAQRGALDSELTEFERASGFLVEVLVVDGADARFYATAAAGRQERSADALVVIAFSKDEPTDVAVRLSADLGGAREAEKLGQRLLAKVNTRQVNEVGRAVSSMGPALRRGVERARANKLSCSWPWC